MYVGKYLIFIVGILAGVAAMFLTGFLSRPTQPEKDTLESSIDVAPPSPFTVVDADPPAEADQLLSLASTDATNPDDTGSDQYYSQEAIDLLIQRIEAAESRIEELEVEVAGFKLSPSSAEDFTPDAEPDLLSAGFEPSTVAAIETMRNDLQLQRLELRDRATREGWINSDRFREERRSLSGSNKLRESLGDEAYDKLLLAEGRDNRVRIDSVIENSAADIAGIEAGDIVVRYADERVFSFRSLQQATTDGARDEPVNIQVQRNGALIDYVIPRGPMGVTLSSVTEPAIP